MQKIAFILNTKITIAIDGFSSTGKSTLAKQLAKHFGYIYVDTGAMYRAVAYFAMQKGFITSSSFDKSALIAALPTIQLSFEFNEALGFAEMYLNNENVETQIRTIEVSNYVSKVAEVSEVRAKLVEQQQEMGKNKGIVMDGRDIGTTILPDADVKIYLTASSLTRAKRRYLELQEKGTVCDLDNIQKDIEERDQRDMNREISPLRQAEDAVLVDSSDLTIEQVVDRILEIFRARTEEGASHES